MFPPGAVSPTRLLRRHFTFAEYVTLLLSTTTKISRTDLNFINASYHLVQNILFFLVLSKINATLILLTELYGCYTWSDALRE